VFVAASTECFADLPLVEALDRLVDLEYTSVEIGLIESGRQLRPSEVHANLDRAIKLCRDTHRLTPVAFTVDMPEGPDYYPQFAACCKLAKATKVVTIAVVAAELGTPFNAEIERLRELVNIASVDGILVGIKTETGRLTENPDTMLSLCNHVKGLGITLDPSHFIFGPQRASYDPLLKHVVHTHLRDTKREKLHVRVGQGEVEYGKLITQLSMVGYERALSVHMQPLDDADHSGEMRKMRLLLESLL
jgi:sugar phosphate isomerase/epimerase